MEEDPRSPIWKKKKNNRTRARCVSCWGALPVAVASGCDGTHTAHRILDTLGEATLPPVPPGTILSTYSSQS